MTTIKHSAPATTETILSTELNSLADRDQVISGNVSNDGASELYRYADFEWYSPTAPSRNFDDPRVELHIVVEIDGTNYGYGSDSVAPSKITRIGSFYLGPFSSERRMHIRRVRIPPTDFKVLIRNFCNAALAASGNTLKMARYSLLSG